MFKRIMACLLAVLLCCGICACGKKTGGEKPAASKAIKIGVLLPDGGNVGTTHAILQGVRTAAEAQKLPEPVCVFNVTDVSFDESEPISAKPAESETAQKTEAEPESFTLEDGEVVVRAVPIPKQEPVKATEAFAEMLDASCSVVVAGDAVYDELTASLAARYPDVTFLQYAGTHTDLANLQSFTDNAAEAFYLAGVAAGSEGVKSVGFTARKGNADEKDCINAFACGVAAYNKEAKITVRFTGVDMDLSLENTIPQTLIEKDKCGLLAQSVYTALPLSVAASQDKPLPCIGCGYDMQSDGGSGYLCSVVFDFGVYFGQAFTSLADGTFNAAAYRGGVKDGMVALSAVQHASDQTLKAVQTETQAVINGERDIFEGFKPAQNGYAANIIIR